MAQTAVSHGRIKLLLNKGLQKHLHHFQQHAVVILTQLPLKVALRSASGMGSSRGFQHQVYAPHTFVKGLILASPVARFTEFL